MGEHDASASGRPWTTGLEPANSRFRDRFDPKVSDWFQQDVPLSFDVALLGAPLSKTSISHSAAFRLPDAVRSAFTATTPYSLNHGLDLSETLSAVDLGNVRMHLTNLLACQVAIEEVVQSYWTAFDVPLLLLGGDHSVTGASVMGMAGAIGQQRMGILHFDAHHDVRNLEDGGRSNGTPFRTILEGDIVPGARIVQVGLRDFANAKTYHEYVLEQGVTVVTARDVRKQTLAIVVAEAVSYLQNVSDVIYVSFDMDVLDQSFVPGVPAPGPGGLNVWDVFECMEWLGQQPNVKMLDIVCADPTQDFRDLTTRVAANVALHWLTGLALRKEGRSI